MEKYKAKAGVCLCVHVCVCAQMHANYTKRQFPISFTLQLLMFAVTNFSKKGFCMLIYL